MKLRITARSVPAVQLLVACLGAGTAAAQWPKEPTLRIDLGTHTAMIRGIDADRAGRWIVTASEDKTVRVWNAQAGALERVLRPPIGEGQTGKLESVAISRDGGLVACGQGADLTGVNSVYLFSRTDGRMLSAVHWESDVVTSVAFSPDGRMLAVGLGGMEGVRLFAIRGGGDPQVRRLVQVASDDKDYKEAVPGIDFSPDGRWLVTASGGDMIRLYDMTAIGQTPAAGLAPAIVRPSPDSGMMLHSARFSPDGTRIAIGFKFANPTMVSVLSARDLHVLYNEDTRDIPGEKLQYLDQLAWSSDGRFLFAGGSYKVSDGSSGERYLVRRWGNNGQGAPSDVWRGAQSTITGLATLADGAIGVVTEDPVVAAIRPDGREIWAVHSNAAEFCTPYLDSCLGDAELQVSADGSAVHFAYGPNGTQPGSFSFGERTLAVGMGPASVPAVARPQTQAPGLGLNWDRRYPSSIRVKGRQLTGTFELASSVAVAQDEQSLLVGTSRALRRCDSGGKATWKIPIPAPVETVNITGNGRLAVVAFGDGTIRWYSYADGRELLALFPHADRKRWVLWTPSGYYDASPGGEELIGWHVNNGPDKEADFFPASRFRGVKYRPDVISKVLDTLDEGDALSLADSARDKAPAKTSVAAALPPVVSIVSPEDGSSISAATVTVRYTVRSPSGEPVTGMRVMIDGRPVPSGPETGSVKKGDEQSVTVAVPARDSEVSVVALNRFSASVAATIHLMWIQTAPLEEFDAKPKLYLLAVGESVYDKPELRLHYAAKDARDFAAAMQAQKGGLYRDVEVRLLTDAPKDDIEDGLEWLRRQVTSRDVGVIFLAGHGVDDSSGMYYFLPANADLDRLMRTGLVFSDLKNTVQSIAGKAVMFVDTCHSGNVMGTRRGLTDINQVVNELASVENGAVVFTASTGRQFSLEGEQWQNGAFTKALVEAIGGKADYTGKGKVTINMLELYLSERVKELTNGQQTPATSKPNTVPDFPLAMKQ